jgi:O-6-methylguanine DNA methyltransferase
MKYASSDILPIYIGRLSSSPIGPLWVATSSQGVCRVEWEMSLQDFTRQVERGNNMKVIYEESHTAEVLDQLADYLRGIRQHFTLPLDFSGMTPFQVNVLKYTCQIPYGETLSYKDIAVKVGNEHAARAVGRVEATNPIPLIIPCHRVLGSDGSLHGYGGPGGIKLKAWLLQLEKSTVKNKSAGGAPAENLNS